MECGKFSEAKESLLKYLNTDYSFYIFPDNNYEESYNMGILLRDLRKSSVSSPKNLLSVLFLDGSYDDTLLLGIQSVNEIASEVLVCLPYSSVIDRNIIENYGANIINIEINRRSKTHFLQFFGVLSKYFNTTLSLCIQETI